MLLMCNIIPCLSSPCNSVHSSPVQDGWIVGYGRRVTEQLLGVLAVWILWTIAVHFLEAPDWLWRTIAIAAGVAWECALNPSWWWLGVGVGGGAAILMLLSDLVLVATDSARVHVLRNTRGK